MKTSAIILFCLAALILPCTHGRASEVLQKQFQDNKVKAENGDAKAQYNLGDMYIRGKGAQTNYAEGIKWFRKSAEQNDAGAECDLGNCYDCGVGVTMDHVEAVKWYRKAAEQNFAPAQFNLGNSYRNGLGVETNYVEAAKWYRKAAEQNYAWAQFNLAHCYAEGAGVEVNGVEAYAWLTLAAKTDKEAAVSLDGLKAQLSPEQFKAAKQRVKELKAQIEARPRPTSAKN